MTKKLRPWEVDPEYARHFCRRDEEGQIVVSLSPEGLDESMCWAWMLPQEIAKRPPGTPLRYHGSTGADRDFETAKKQGDEAARALGYEVE